MAIVVDWDVKQTISNSRIFIQKVDKSIRRVCETPLTSMYFHVCKKNYRASPS